MEEEGTLAMRTLSSGEKQIVSLFSHLYLSGQQLFFVIIDEPELSLSVPGSDVSCLTSWTLGYAADSWLSLPPHSSGRTNLEAFVRPLAEFTVSYSAEGKA
jgi:hypothetical protein